MSHSASVVLLLVAVFAGMPSGVAGVCSAYNTEKYCLSEYGCVWDSFRCKPCHQVTSTISCSRYPACYYSGSVCRTHTNDGGATQTRICALRGETSCKAQWGCVWDISRTCEPCHYTTSSINCQREAACKWVNNRCLVITDTGGQAQAQLCESKGENSCKAQWGCVWDISRTCEPCQYTTSSINCRREVDCEWDSSRRLCKTLLSTGGAAQQAVCSARFSQGSCQDVWGCYWDSLDRTCVACQALSSSSDCSRATTCVWSNGLCHVRQ